MQLIATAIALIAGLLTSVFTPTADRPIPVHKAQVHAGAGLPLADQPDAALLLSKAEEDGTIGVIVGFDFALRDDDGLTREQVADQDKALLAAEDALIARAGFGTDAKRFEASAHVAGQADRTVLARLFADPSVSSVEEDMVFQVQLKDSTRIINADDLWKDKDVTGKKTIVVIIDTGVDPDHPMLKDKIVGEACFSTNSPSLQSLCSLGFPTAKGPGSGENCGHAIANCEHGTVVASIAAGGAYKGYSGVAPDAQIIAIKAASKRVKGTGCTPLPCAELVESDVVKAMEFIEKHHDKYEKNGNKVVAVNLSIGFDQYGSTCDKEDRATAMAEAVRKLKNDGIATIAATGNTNYDGFVQFPACLSDVIGVGATDKDDHLWIFTNLGMMTKLMAPGAGIVAAVPKKTSCAKVGGKPMCSFDGTSVAAPHVTGAWALLKSAVPKAPVPDVLSALNCRGRLIQGYDAYHGSNKYHRPRINLLTAYNELTDPPQKEVYKFDNKADKWNEVLGDWRVAGGTWKTSTSSWPSASPWGISSTIFCSPGFTVTARLKQADPENTGLLPLETGFLLATHVTQIVGLGDVRASGYVFLISKKDGGMAEVKRFDDKQLDVGTLSDEQTICGPLQPGIELDQYHTLAAHYTPGRIEFSLDGAVVCTVKERQRYAPPAKVALLAKRGVTGKYDFIVDKVTLDPD